MSEVITAPQLKQKSLWTCMYKGVLIEISHHGVSESSFMPNGTYCYYIYLYENKTAKFSELWLPDEVKEFSGGRKYVSHDYMQGRINDADWHGGITYYAKHGHTEGFRCAQFGCDYAHLYDDQCDCNENDLFLEAKHVADQLVEWFGVTQ